ncbi:Uncharacterised protein [Vibrio cholerae]|nr:Uncharacterised protein [Vibrio cholerae]
MPLMLEIAVSTRSTPASIALSRVISARPAVEWQCRCSSTSTCFFRVDTSSSAAYGVKMPAISFRAIESTPSSASCCATSTQVCKLCTGLVV